MNFFLILCSIVIIAAVNARWITPGVWGDWGTCSKPCGYGRIAKEKMCGTYVCASKSATCNTFECNDPLVSPLLSWTTCSKSCHGEKVGSTVSFANAATLSCNDQCDVSYPTCNKQVVILADRSGNVGTLNFLIQKQFIKDLISTFGSNSDISLIAYSTKATTYQNLGTGNSLEMTKDNVDSMIFDGDVSQTISGVAAALDQVELHSNAVVVILSEGGTVSPTGIDPLALAAAEQIRKHATIIGVHVTEYDNYELVQMSDQVIRLSDVPLLPTVVQQVAAIVCE